MMLRHKARTAEADDAEARRRSPLALEPVMDGNRSLSENRHDTGLLASAPQKAGSGHAGGLASFQVCREVWSALGHQVGHMEPGYDRAHLSRRAVAIDTLSSATAAACSSGCRAGGHARPAWPQAAAMSSYLLVAGRTGRILRRMGFDRNPMRRASDRAHAILKAVLVATFLIGGPITTAYVSHEVEVAGMRAGRAQAADWQRVPAVVTREKLIAVAWRHPGTGKPAVLSVRWKTPRGWSRTGQIQVGRPAVAGSKIAVWLDPSGRLTHPPLTRIDITDRVIGAAIATLAALAFLLWLAGKTALLAFDRHRLARWEADWLAVEPLWTNRR